MHVSVRACGCACARPAYKTASLFFRRKASSDEDRKTDRFKIGVLPLAIIMDDPCALKSHNRQTIKDALTWTWSTGASTHCGQPSRRWAGVGGGRAGQPPPTSWTPTRRGRGPSASTSSTLCHCPSTSRPPATGMVSAPGGSAPTRGGGGRVTGSLPRTGPQGDQVRGPKPPAVKKEGQGGGQPPL